MPDVQTVGRAPGGGLEIPGGYRDPNKTALLLREGWSVMNRATTMLFPCAFETFPAAKLVLTARPWAAWGFRR